MLSGRTFAHFLILHQKRMRLILSYPMYSFMLTSLISLLILSPDKSRMDYKWWMGTRESSDPKSQWQCGKGKTRLRLLLNIGTNFALEKISELNGSHKRLIKKTIGKNLGGGDFPSEQVATLLHSHCFRDSLGNCYLRKYCAIDWKLLSVLHSGNMYFMASDCLW